MEELADRFVRERESLKSGGFGPRVPLSLRALAVRYGRWSLSQGASVVVTSARLGVSRLTLTRWLSESPSSEPFREVVVREPTSGLSTASGVTLVTPEGYRVEGLDGSTLAGLLRALR
jgi:hypothetical protein